MENLDIVIKIVVIENKTRKEGKANSFNEYNIVATMSEINAIKEKHSLLLV